MRHLRTFLAVCESGSLTRAAEGLNTVQPALSRSLRELERQVGAPLFLRGARGLTLTPEGETLRRHVAAGLAQIESGLARAGGARQSETVAIGMLPNVARSLLPDAIARFKRGFPEVTVSLTTGSVPELVDLLRRGRIDFLASRLVSVEQLAGVVFEHLYDEPLIFCVRAGHPLGAGGAVTLPEVADFPVIVPPPGTIIRQELERFLFARGQPMFADLIETVSIEFTLSHMWRQDVVAFVPEGALRRELEEGRIRDLRIGPEELTGAVGISTLSDRALSGSARRMLGDIRAVASERAKP